MKITQNDIIEAKKTIDKFVKSKTDEEIFYNLCFAILAPQTTFKSNKKATARLKEHDFYHKNINETTLHDIVRSTRFYKQKTERLLRAKKQFRHILKCVRSTADSERKRDFLVRHVNGLGMKAASHLLRNTGCRDLAIIDTHVLKFMQKDAPKNKKEYLELEMLFLDESNKRYLWPAELDAIIWKHYSNTDWKNFVY